MIGFDKFKEYVTGKEDGVPKTPQWASEITGIPSRIIKALARNWAKRSVSIAHGNGGPMIRGPYATEVGRLEVVLLGMQGLGKPGANQVKMLEWGLYCQSERSPMPRPSLMPNPFQADRGWSGPDRLQPMVRQIIPKDLIHDAILNPPISWYGKSVLSRDPVEFQFEKYTYPAEGCSGSAHALAGHRLLDHQLERHEQLHQGPPKPEDRVHPVPEPVAGERRAVCRHHSCPRTPSSRWRISGWRFRAGSSTPSSSTASASSRGGSRRAAMKSPASLPRDWGCSKNTPKAKRRMNG